MKNCGFNFQNTYINLSQYFYSQIHPQAVPAPDIVIINKALVHEMGLYFSNLTNQELAAIFSGNQLPDGAQPLAQAYAGHQFGYFTMLGDGRAHLIGEHIQPNAKRVDIQLKGSGRTPYSRNGDGRAALGPMLREYIISEAMHALNIPTTRCLAVVTTGETVLRQTPLPGAILTRVASSHIRVGTFEFAAALQNEEFLKELLDYTVNRHYPHLNEATNKALGLLENVIEQQANLIVDWMRVGFIHGVMNTDNMTISGQTIDYGPCAFMDAYDPNTVFSSIDHNGRYAYANQPFIAQWNLVKLANALLPLIDSDSQKAIKLAENKINSFSEIYKNKWLSMMGAKLGLINLKDGDEKLISDLLNWMHKNGADYTNTFRDLATQNIFQEQIYSDRQFKSWAQLWQARLQENSQPLESAFKLMKDSNPAIIARNHKVEEALKAATQKDLKPFHALLEALKTPHKDSPDLKAYKLSAPPEQGVYKTFCGT